MHMELKENDISLKNLYGIYFLAYFNIQDFKDV